jgi:hypothetical protein
MSRRHETVVALRCTDRERATPQQSALASGIDDMADVLGDDKLLTPKQAAVALGFADPTLQAWRAAGVGPPYVSINGKCRGYRVGALRAWLRSHERGGKPE